MTDSEPTLAELYPSYAGNPRVLALFEREWPGYARTWMETPATCTPQDVPDLVRMATDPDLLHSFEEREWTAALEALYELGRLEASEAGPAIIGLIREPWGEDDSFDEYRQEIFSGVIGMIGPSMIDELGTLLNESEMNVWGRVEGVTGLEKIGLRHPAHRDEIVGILAQGLRSHQTQDDAINGFIVASLCELKGAEAIAVIREAFEAENVPLDISGDLESVEVELGLRESRATPERNVQHLEAERLARKSGPTSEPIVVGEKVGRNDPCPCGSGKKYKHCCLRKG